MEIQLLSERDLVAQRIFPRFKEASKVVGISDVLDFHIDARVDGGIADLFAEKGGRRLFVLEAKFKKKEGRIVRDIEPRNPEVIDQASHYALYGGFPFYITCNEKRIILFKHMTDLPPLQSEVASFEFQKEPNWAEKILSIILHPAEARLKALDDSLVDTLREAFNDLLPEFLSSLKNRLSETDFCKSYIEWLENQGIQLNDETNRLMAEQSCYLQLNKLLFYQVIRTIYPDRLDVLEVGEQEEVSKALTRFYNQARKIDYAPVYEPDVISEVPLTKRAQERFRTLIDTLNRFDFAGMQSDFLGRVYEKLIPPTERKRLGQFYTPLSIVDLIIDFTIRDQNTIILDPSCGSGSFLIKAYDKLRELKQVPNETLDSLSEHYHKEILSQIYGVDINRFPAHLSVINLAIQNPRSRVDHVNIAVKDFFDIKGGQATLSGFESVTGEGQGSIIELPSTFDVVVANPPYIRQELLGEREKRKIRLLIEKEFNGNLGIGASVKKSKNALIFDKQSDIYLYFFVHSLELLKETGYLGFISSNKWLEVAYGEPFQEFLLKYSRIKCIVEFDRAIFPDADVNTAVTILRKESDQTKRAQNLVKFVRVKQRMDMHTLVNLIDETLDSIEDDQIRISVIHQADLRSGKWSVYLRAPTVYHKIINNSRIINLDEIAKIFRGPVTGYNDYFIISKDKAKDWKIEQRFLKPCISSPRKIRGLVVENKDIGEYMFLLDLPKSKLEGTHALDYIKYGEKLDIDVTRGSMRGKRKLSELETLSSRNLWYAVPNPEDAPILLPYMIDKRPRAIENLALAQATDVNHYIIPNDKDWSNFVLGFLNSTLAALLIELHGRSYGGGILKIQVYELKDMPVIDPRKLSPSEISEVGDAFNSLAEAVEHRISVEEETKKIATKSKKDKGLFDKELAKQLEESDESEKQAQKRLDSAVGNILGLNPKERKQIENSLTELQEIRRLRTQSS